MRPAIRRLAAPVLALGFIGSLAVPSALAASLVVNSLADVAANDGGCTLREAITAANTDTASGAAAGECPAGSGTDVITFSVAGTITLTSALPSITSNMSISGDGAITVSGASTFRVFIIPAGTVTLSGLTITAGAAFNGAGILNAGSLSVAISTISGNSTGSFGGGIANSGAGATLSLTNSTVTGNAASRGGGIWNQLGTVGITNSTIIGNTAGTGLAIGGGIENLDGTVTITNSTISRNTAGTGGGIAAAGTESLVNVIVAGNTAPTGPDVDGTAETITTSVIGVPGGKTLADILVPAGLANNGGPTQTVALALVAGNPAIDAGTSSVCAAAPVNAIDQRGLPRPTACDIGAYEAQPPNIAAHSDVSVAVSPPAPTVVTYTPPAGTDEQGGTAAVPCTPPSGSSFPVGTTTVTCTATDAVGHTASGSFQVIVTALAAPTPPAPSLPNGAMWSRTNAMPDTPWMPGLLTLLVLVVLLSLVALWQVSVRVRDKRR
jgi:CSLREA domain-containing protein